MSAARLLGYSNPAEGRDAEYNRWYDEQHIPDLLNIPGVEGAQRFRLGEGDWSYVTIYELSTDDEAALMAEFAGRAGTAAMPLSDAIDIDSVKLVFCIAASPPRRN